MSKKTQEFLLGVLASIVAAAIWAAIKLATHAWSLWLAGLAGFGMASLVFAILQVRQLRQSARFAARIEGSPFEFHKLLAKAQHSIFAIGPNLNFLMNNQKIKQLFFQKLSDPNFRGSLLVCDPTSATANLLHEIGYSGDFNSQLRKSIDTFQLWSKEHPNLLVKIVGPLTASIVFVDADQDTGALLIIPLPWRVSGENRPCFLLSKKVHHVAFNTYYDSYRALFRSDIAKNIE